MTETENKPWAFLAFSLSDNRAQRAESPTAENLCWADWLAAALKSYAVPPEFIGQVNGRGEIIPERLDALFSLEAEPATTATLSAEVRQALAQSRCLVVICSPRSAGNLQVNEAVRYFKQLGRAQQILPLVIAGEPFASEIQPAHAEECFGPALRHPVWPDGTVDPMRRAGKSIFVDARHQGREILAPDTRLAEADLEMAKIQLIALLLGVGFNNLWQREQKRHFFDLSATREQMRAALTQVAEVQGQLQMAQQQVRAAQTQALENQNLPRAVQGQIQEAQTQARLAEDQARAAQKQLQEFQTQVRETQTQLEDARQRARAAESKVLEAQQQTRAALEQLESTRQQVRTAQAQVLETPAVSSEVPEQILAAQTQLAATQQQVVDAETKFLAAESLVQALQEQVRVTQTQLAAAQQQVRAAENKIATEPKLIPPSANPNANARRLTKILAVLTVLAIMAAGIATNEALRQRTIAAQALAKADAATAANLVTQPIRQVLQTIGGATPAENQRRALAEIAAGISPTEIPEALSAATVIADDEQRTRFQKYLLIRLGWANPLSAMTNAETITATIVTDEGASDSPLYLQLAVLENWLATDFAGAFSWMGALPSVDAEQRALEKAIAWLNAQPDSATKTAQLTTCLDALAIITAPTLPSILQLPTATWPWTKFSPDATLGGLIVVPVATEVLAIATDSPTATNSAAPIKANE